MGSSGVLPELTTAALAGGGAPRGFDACFVLGSSVFPVGAFFGRLLMGAGVHGWAKATCAAIGRSSKVEGGMEDARFASRSSPAVRDLASMQWQHAFCAKAVTLLSVPFTMRSSHRASIGNSPSPKRILPQAAMTISKRTAKS